MLHVCMCVCTHTLICQDKLRKSDDREKIPTIENIFRNPTVHKKVSVNDDKCYGELHSFKGNGLEMKPC